MAKLIERLCKRCKMVKIRTPDLKGKYCAKCVKERQKEYFRKWAKQKYNSDPEYRERIKGYVRKYLRTPKGARSRKKAISNLLRSQPDYYRNYCKIRRARLKKERTCQACLVNKAARGRVLCWDCSLKRRKGFVNNYVRIEKKKKKKRSKRCA